MYIALLSNIHENPPKSFYRKYFHLEWRNVELKFEETKSNMEEYDEEKENQIVQKYMGEGNFFDFHLESTKGN